MSSDPDYKIRHVVTPIERLLKYQWMPPNMVGDPKPDDEDGWESWEQREVAVYLAMMKLKRGNDRA